MQECSSAEKRACLRCIQRHGLALQVRAGRPTMAACCICKGMAMVARLTMKQAGK